MTGLTVLLIDDDEIFHLVHTKMLESSRLAGKIHSVYNGRDGVDKLVSLASMNKIPDLILVDLQMPVADGFEFLESLNAMNPEIRRRTFVSVLSSSNDFRDRERAEKLGIDLYLAKPLAVDVLKRILKGVPFIQQKIGISATD